MLFLVWSDAPPSVPPAASFVVDASWECLEPPALVESMNSAAVHRLCGVHCSDDFSSLLLLLSL